jgi:bifunctional DNA-binding transcriptional regulator/antitoxin component of YhaV-PrlF toxin-antitoxin module
MTTAEVKVDESGDTYLVFPEGYIEQLGWAIGDEIKWTDNNDGSWTMTKVEKTEFVLVEAIGQFRMRYMVEVPVGKKEWAGDVVVMEQAKEFSQLSLGETIISSRVIPKEEIIPLCNEDNDYVKTWADDQKLNAFVTTIKDYENV